MRTAIVSDLHLGSGFGEDLLRDAQIRRTLFERLASADRLVLLGDALELRELPLATALEYAQPFFAELAAVMTGGTVILVPGNHDHRLAEPLLEQLALAGQQLGLEHCAAPGGEPAMRIATWLGDTELTIAYPGIWLRDDVYATHGHYMDCHMTLPRLECIAAAATMRALRPLPSRPEPADYERVLQPVYGLTYGLAQGGFARRAARPSERAWRSISSKNGNGHIRRAALRAAVPATIWSINRLLHSDFDAKFSSGSISTSGIAAATEMARRLRLEAAHTIVGHTHRAGPCQTEAQWKLSNGGQLHNTGSWVFASAFHHPGTPPGPYWPGTITWLEDSGQPQRENLLQERTGDELSAVVARMTV